MTVDPTQLPVSVDELKEQLRYTANDFDSRFSAFIEAATQYCQEYQWSQLCTATFVDRFDRFCDVITPQRSPVQSVTSVQYVDTGGTTQTLVANTDYTVDVSSKPCRIVPAYSKCWPATRGHLNDVIVTYVAGYGDPADVPQEIKHAILLKAAQAYEACDSSSIEDAVKSLLDKRSFRTMF